MPPKRKNQRATKPATTATTPKSQPTAPAGTGTGTSTNGVSAIKRRRSSVQAGKPSTSRLQPSEPLHMTTRGAAKQASSQGTSPAAAPSPSSLGDGNNSRRSSLNGIGNGHGNASFADDHVAVASTADSGSRRNSQQMGSFVSQLPDVQQRNQQEPPVAASSPPKTAGRKRKASGADSNNNNANATTTTTTTKTTSTANGLASQMDSDQSEKQPRRKKRKTANTPSEPADAPPELTDDASSAPASPEEPIPEVAPSDTLQNVLPASDVPAKRRLPGRRRQPHANINVEVNLRRQLNLKMSYRKLAKEQKAVLEELAKRTLHKLHEEPKFHKEAPEYEHVMRQLEERRQKRMKEIEDEREIKLAQLERVRVAQEHIQREQYINRFREFQENYILQCKYRMKQIERQMRAEQGEATDDEEYVVEATHMAFPLHDENDVLGSRYASRSRAYVETERMLRDDEMRARLNERRISFVAKNPDHENEATIPDSFGNFSGPEAEREEAVAHYNLGTLLEATTAMEVDGELPASTQVEVEVESSKGVTVEEQEPAKPIPAIEVPEVIPNDQATALFLLASLSTERPVPAEEPAAEEEEKQQALTRELSPGTRTPKADDAPVSTESALVREKEEQPLVEFDGVSSPGKRADSTGRKSPSQAPADQKQVADAGEGPALKSPPRLPGSPGLSVEPEVQPPSEQVRKPSIKPLSSGRQEEVQPPSEHIRKPSIKPLGSGQKEEETADYIPLDVGTDHEDDYLDRVDMPVENGTSPKPSAPHSQHPAGDTSVADEGEPMDLDNDTANGQTSTQYMTSGSKGQSLERIEKAWGHGAIDELVKGRVGITQSDLSNQAVLDCLAQIATSDQDVTVADFIEAAIWDQEKNGPWSLGSRVPHVGDIKRVQRRLKERKSAGFGAEDGREKLPSEKLKVSIAEGQRHPVKNQSRTMSTPVNPMDVLDKLRALARDKVAGEEAAESRVRSPRSPKIPAEASSGQYQAPTAGSSQREAIDLAPQPSDSPFYSGSTAGHHRDRLSMSAIMNDDRHEDELARRRSLPTFHEVEARMSRHDPSLPLSRMRAVVRTLQDDSRRPWGRDASVSEEHRSTSLSMEPRPEERRRVPLERDSTQTTTYHTPAPTSGRDGASPQARPAGLAQQGRRDSYGRDNGPKPPTSWEPSRRTSESAASTARPSAASTPSHARPPPGLAHPLAYPTPKRPRHSTSSSSSLPPKPPAPASQPPVNFRFAHYEPAPARPAPYQSGPPPPQPAYSSPAHPYGPPPPPVYQPTTLPPTYMGIQQPVGTSAGGGYVPPPGSFQAPPPPPPLQHHQQRPASPPVYPPMRVPAYAEQQPQQQQQYPHHQPPSAYTHMGPPLPQPQPQPQAQTGYAYATSPPQGHASPALVGSPVMVPGQHPQQQQGQGQGQAGQGEPRPRRQYRAYHAPETKFRAYQGPRGPRG